LVTDLLQNSSSYFAELKQAAKSACMKAISDSEIDGIGSYLLRQAASNIILFSVLNEPNAEVESILSLIEDRDYEIRLLALEKLANYFERYLKSSQRSFLG
jgi:hypothetical protein